jgi:hypothetical protein
VLILVLQLQGVVVLVVLQLQGVVVLVVLQHRLVPLQLRMVLLLLLGLVLVLMGPQDDAAVAGGAHWQWYVAIHRCFQGPVLDP